MPHPLEVLLSNAFVLILHNLVPTPPTSKGQIHRSLAKSLGHTPAIVLLVSYSRCQRRNLNRLGLFGGRGRLGLQGRDLGVRKPHGGEVGAIVGHGGGEKLQSKRLKRKTVGQENTIKTYGDGWVEFSEFCNVRSWITLFAPLFLELDDLDTLVYIPSNSLGAKSVSLLSSY